MASGYDSDLGDPVLLAKMDKLREKGITEYIPLPQVRLPRSGNTFTISNALLQLVVVGDQSSGKSSVLEGLTELPFPRDSTLCTRFATQIIFQRAEQESVSVSIIPSPSSNAARQEKLKAFKDDGLKAFSADDFKRILAQASETMGIPALGCPRAEGQSNFSDDVFRIELCGPEKNHLSVIDVPGIFRTTEEGLTTEEDKLLVRNMVRRYIESPRTIILAVLAANVDIATTEILDMAAEVDSTGQRTLGILTKPDLVDKGAEQDIIDLVRGRKKKLKLGYCVVRNRGKQERNLSSIERNRIELEFFKGDPWSSLDKSRVSISALSPRLRDLLSRITRHEFPTVIREIADRLATCEEELRDLGPSRQTPEQQRKYLLGIATKFQEITTFAVEAQYGRHQFLKDDRNLRLATLIVDFNSAFSADMERRGHAVNFTESIVAEICPPPSFVEKKPGESQEEAFTDIKLLWYPELINFLPTASTSPPHHSMDILSWIEFEYKSFRGFELGTFNPSILPTLFQELSMRWEDLVGTYLANIIASTHHFCNTLLARLCTEERVLAALWSLLIDELLHRYRKMVAHVQFILQTERSGNLLTTNHYFHETLDKLRLERSAKPTEGFSFGSGNAARKTTIDNAEHTVRDIHDILKSYYKVARKRFVDNVCMQGTDYHLITGPDTPLHVFSPEFVVELSVERLEAVAGEDATSIQQRKSVEKEIESLTEGRRILTT
ncbi:MAG: hypothetical protein M1835_003243 [Candelina submexicana]|nr:MAG: hypothetical protein M1835_003243 [Candelina submexicana]